MSKLIEKWKPINGYEGLYEVSNEGRVRSVKTNKLRKLILNDKGYYDICLSKEGKTKHKPVHRLVAESFLDNTDNKPCVEHCNTIKTDNRVENLRWTTYHENNSNPITCKKRSETLTGKHLSEETKKKLSDALKGENGYWFGRKFSEEHKMKLRKPKSK